MEGTFPCRMFFFISIVRYTLLACYGCLPYYRQLSCVVGREHTNKYNITFMCTINPLVVSLNVRSSSAGYKLRDIWECGVSSYPKVTLCRSSSVNLPCSRYKGGRIMKRCLEEVPGLSLDKEIRRVEKTD